MYIFTHTRAHTYIHAACTHAGTHTHTHIHISAEDNAPECSENVRVSGSSESLGANVRCETLVSVAVEKFINALSQLYRYSDISPSLVSLCTLRGVFTPSGAGGRELISSLYHLRLIIGLIIRPRSYDVLRKERERERERERKKDYDLEIQHVSTFGDFL